MSKRTILIILLLGGFLKGYSQSDSVTTSVYLDEVVVSAMKTPTAQRLSTKPVQVVDKATIQKNGGRDLVQLIQQETGIIVNGAFSNPGKNKEVYTRGALSKYTLILIDGIPASDASDVGAAFDLRLIPLQSIDRIEVLRGSQSTLYGSDAIAGVINIITSQQGEIPKVEASASFGSLNTRETTIRARGGTSNIRYDIGLSHFATDGVSEALAPSDTASFQADPAERNYAQGSFTWMPVANLEIQPFFRYSRFGGDYDDGPFQDAPNRYSSEMINPGFRSVFKTASGNELTVLYQYLQSDRTFFSSFGESPFNGRTHNADAFGTIGISNRVRLVGGFLLQAAQLMDDMALEVNPSYQIYSPYLTLLASGLGNWNVEVGYRLNHHTDFGNHSNFSIAPSFDVNNSLRLFGSFTTGFKSPTLNQLYGQFGPNPNLQPETSQSLEVGAAAQLLSGELSMNLAFFRREIQDVIIFDFTNGYQNQDRQNDHGVDLTFNYRITDRTRLTGGYQYVDGELTTRNASSQDTSFYNLIRRPRHSATLGIDLSITDRLSLAVNGQYVGDRIDYFFDPANFFALSEVGLDSYVLVNARAEYTFWEDRLGIYADVRNLLDQEFMESYGFGALGVNLQAGARIRVF